MNVGQVLQYLPPSPAGDPLRTWAAAAAWVARTLTSSSIASVPKVKQNFAFGLTLNANHVSTAERDAIRGRYIKGWAEDERLNHGKSAEAMENLQKGSLQTDADGRHQ